MPQRDARRGSFVSLDGDTHIGLQHLPEEWLRTQWDIGELSMYRCRVDPTLLMRSFLCFAILILLPTWAQASDISFDGGFGCDDPPIFNGVFSFSANSNGGFCTGFGNHSGVNFDSLTFVTTIPTVSPFFSCSPEPFFTSCDFIEDAAANTLTILFFGLDGPLGSHHGIPVAPDCPVGTPCLPGVPPPDNFFINLNNRTCPPIGGACTQPNDSNGTGDWLANGLPNVFRVAANVREPASVPEPGTWTLLLGGIGALLARAKLTRKGHYRG